ISAEPAASASVDAEHPTGSRRGLVLGIAAAALVVIVSVIVGVSLPSILGGAVPTPTPVTESDPKDPVSAVVPEPEDLTGTPVTAGVLFSWSNADPQEGDHFLVGVVARGGEEPDFESVTGLETTVPADPSGTTCVEVMLVRENGQSSDPVSGCTP
ncbi:MAG: serine/threonine protein kinase, partial [Microbacterium sp.]